MASRLLGLLREILIAARFGTSPEYDAYVAAFRIPDLVFLVVMSGAFGSAFIPVYAELLTTSGRRTAWRLANTLLSFSLLTFVLVTVLTIVSAEWLIRTIVAPGLTPAAQELAANLTRVLMLSPLFLGIGAAAKAMLEAEARFTEPAAAPLLYNLGIIAGALLFAPPLGITGLAFGVVIGAAAYAVLQLGALYRSGWRFAVTVQSDVPGLADVVRLLGPRLLAQAAMQINLVVMTNLGSRLGHQAIASLQYAYQVFLLPHGVIALSIATVLFPTLARYRSLGAVDEVSQTFARSLRVSLVLTMPISVLFIFFARSIVQTLFQFGAFTATSTVLVSEALRWFAPGLVAYAVVELLTRLSYAFKDSRSPVVAAFVAVVTNLVLGLLLMRPFGHRGLALSLALATTLEMVVLATLVRKHVALSYRQVGQQCLRALPALIVLAVAAWGFAAPLERATDPTAGRSLGQVLAFVLTLSAIAMTYVTLLTVWRQPDALLFVSRVRDQVGRRVGRILGGILDR